MDATQRSLADELAGLAQGLPANSVFGFDFLDDGTFWLERLRIPAEARGIGTRFLAEVFCACDRWGIGAFLVAEGSGEPGDPDTLGLVNWYRRLGAVPCERAEGWPDGGVGMKRHPGDRSGDVRELLRRYEEAKLDCLSRGELDSILSPARNLRA